MTRRSWYWWLLVLPLAFGASRLRFDTEILNLLPPGLPVVEGLKFHLRHFSDVRELLIVVEAAEADEAEGAARSLSEVLQARTNLVSTVVWQPAWLKDPREAMELVAYSWLNQAPSDFAALTNRLSQGNVAGVLEEARQELATSLSPADLALRSHDPFGLLALPESALASVSPMRQGNEGFASEDGRFRLVFVQARPDIGPYRACRAWLKQIRQEVASAQADGRIPGGARIRFTGRPAFVDEISGGMEGDMAGSAGGTLATIGILFWLTHRRIRPLAWLLFLLLVILAGTLALGGLFFGTLNVVSLGFASILAGLAEDFGIVIYQESRSHPDWQAGALRRAVAPGIYWSALTTAGAFLLLNLSSLPGLAALGNLVAIGVLLATFVMLFLYLPVLLKLRRPGDAATGGNPPERFLLFAAGRQFPPAGTWLATAALGAVAAAVLAWQGPGFDRSPNVLKPKRSEAGGAMEDLKRLLGRGREPGLLLINGGNAEEVAARLSQLGQELDRAVAAGEVERYLLPTSIWPNTANQRTNRLAARGLLDRQAQLLEAAATAGFTRDSLVLTEGIFAAFRRAVASESDFWPEQPLSRWVFAKVQAATSTGVVALGSVWPSTNRLRADSFRSRWSGAVPVPGVTLTGWELLGTAVFERVMSELPKLVGLISLLVLATLWLAFRNVREVMLSAATLGFTAILLAGAMILLRWDWNLLNLMALPLLMGMGVDFSIHIQLALRHARGDRLEVRRSVGRALLLAGATTVAGFGSLAFSTNAGMASLGRVCALGILLALLVAVYLLPVWWLTIVGPAVADARSTPSKK